MIDACEMSTLADPLFVKVKVCDSWDPTVTLPKDSLPGLDPRSPEVDVPVPVPESETVFEVLVALLEIVTVALKVPAAFGANSMLIGVLCPAAMVMGTLGEAREKYLVENETALTLTGAGPELVAVTVRDLRFPAATLPNCSVAALSESVAVCC